MPLKDVQLEDTPHILLDRVHETRRELIAAYERVEELEGGLKGLLGLLTLVSNNPDLPASIREILASNHRVIDAQEMLRS